MEVSRRCDYACRILRAAFKREEGFVSIAEVAEEESIPYAFARSIQHDLTSAGFISTARGARGGLALKCNPDEVTLLDIVIALQGPASVSQCASNPQSCAKQPSCVFNRVWQGADRILFSYFSSITLGALFEQGGDHPLVAQAIALDGEKLPVFLETLSNLEEPSDAPLSEAILTAGQACATCPESRVEGR
ncbi:MAG: Rrf2 family transcriptional regulator [Raoultibacter sp.]